VTWVDWIIGGVFVFFIYQGFRQGLILQLCDLLGSIFALILAFYFYGRVGEYLMNNFQLSPAIGNIVGFILVVVAVTATVSFLGARWHEANKPEIVALLDGGAGALFGGMKAAVILIVVLLVLLVLPWKFMDEPLIESNLATDILRLAPMFAVLQDKTLPANLPRLVVNAEGVRFGQFKEGQFLDAKCVACGTKVFYSGMKKQGLVSYPQYYCPKCHRISDGCLTFEGFHQLNGVCPYERFGTMGMTDCKIWSNLTPTKINGRCPVCGRTQ